MYPTSRRITGILAATVLAAAMAGSVSAAPPPIAITITSTHLVAKIQVIVGFDVVCQPLVSAIDGSPVTTAALGFGATMDQANGKKIAHAEGGDLMPNSNRLITCDGTTVTHLSVTMLSATVPFHKAAAIAGVRVNVDDPSCIYCGSDRTLLITPKVKLG